MDLSEARARIDEIDRQLVELFCQRMTVSRDVAAWKKENNLPLTDPERERNKLVEVARQAGEEFQGYTAALYSQLFDLSKAYQAQLNRGKAPLCTQIDEAIARTPEVFPEWPGDIGLWVSGMMPRWYKTVIDRDETRTGLVVREVPEDMSLEIWEYLTMLGNHKMAVQSDDENLTISVLNEGLTVTEELRTKTLIITGG